MKKPNTKEQTGQQSGMVGTGYRSPVTTTSKPTFETYRKMRENPTISLARIVATAPIRCAEWHLEASKGTPLDRVKFIEKAIQKIWHSTVNDSLLALDYGFAPAELIYEAGAGGVTVQRVKPLLVDKTTILTDDHGNFTGLKNQDVELSEDESFLYSHDVEAGNLYGRSRHENIRASAWCEWNDLQKKRARYFKKSAGSVPMVHYPDGEATDAGGAKLPNYRLAKMLIDHLQDGNGICFPTMMKPWAQELARDGRSGEDMEAWKVDFLETKAQHGNEFTEAMTHCESLMLRGWLVPERAASEARTAGSRADSETHADWALTAADMILQDICISVQQQIVNRLLILNYGDKAKNTVRLCRASVAPELQDFFRGLIKATLANPTGVQLLLKLVDLNALIVAAGLPTPKSTPSPDELEAAVKRPAVELSRAVLPAWLTHSAMEEAIRTAGHSLALERFIARELTRRSNDTKNNTN